MWEREEGMVGMKEVGREGVNEREKLREGGRVRCR